MRRAGRLRLPRLNSLPGPTMCSCPRYSPSEHGRIRAASGASLFILCCIAWSNKSGIAGDCTIRLSEASAVSIWPETSPGTQRRPEKDPDQALYQKAATPAGTSGTISRNMLKPLVSRAKRVALDGLASFKCGDL